MADAGLGRKILAGLGLAASTLYLLNPGAGVFELLPDNLPIVGNLDEAAAVGLMAASWRALRRARLAGGASGAVQPPASKHTDGTAI